MKRFFVLVPLLLGSILFAQITAPPLESNTELNLLVQEDQRVRMSASLTAAERAAITRTDFDRLTAVKKMIAASQLHTGLDYRNASLIMQHSHESDDYLLAHTLAVIGVSKGDKICLWLSTATLDRYLMSIKQPQIYGTQYLHPDPTKPWTQEPYNDTLITDSLRLELTLPSSGERTKQLDDLNKPSHPK
jgi:hypothetical protein